MFEGYDLNLILLSVLVTSGALVYCCKFITRIFFGSTAEKSTLVPLYSVSIGSVLFGICNLNWIAMNPIVGSDLSISMMLGALFAAIFVAYNAFSNAHEKNLPFSVLINRGFVVSLSSYAMFYLVFASRHPANSISIDVINLLIALASGTFISSSILLYFFKMKTVNNNRSNLLKVMLTLGCGALIVSLNAIFSSTLQLEVNTIGLSDKVVNNRELLATTISLSIASLLLITFTAHKHIQTFKSKLSKFHLFESHADNSLNAKDALTQLPNRRGFDNQLNTSINRSARSGKTVALAFIDLDHFKPVNDNFGHRIGDAVLVNVAQRLSAAVRGCDIVARIGGDEFTAIIDEINADEDITLIVQRIVEAISQPFFVENHKIEISCSVGVALYPADGDIDKLMICADAAMYKAKDSGKNQFKFYDAETEQASDDLIELQRGLRLAIERNEFCLVYQPKLDCKTLAPIGAEALLRWNHPTKGIVLPKDFIPAAERFGLMSTINEWVIAESCRTMQRANIAGINFDLSINLARQQFRNANLVEDIIDLTNKYNVPKNNLIFEIKETTAIKNEALFKNLLGQFKAANMRVALDDFGAHPFTLTYLQNLNVDEIKLDKHFVSSITDDKTSWKLVDVLIVLAHTLNLNVVAEGVETDAQKNALTQLGCNHMQGYLFSKPISEEKLLQIIKNQNIGFDIADKFSVSDYQEIAA